MKTKKSRLFKLLRLTFGNGRADGGWRSYTIGFSAWRIAAQRRENGSRLGRTLESTLGFVNPVLGCIFNHRVIHIGILWIRLYSFCKFKKDKLDVIQVVNICYRCYSLTTREKVFDPWTLIFCLSLAILDNSQPKLLVTRAAQMRRTKSPISVPPRVDNFET